MGVYAVEVAVATRRPPRADATIYYTIDAPDGLTAELTACQWAAVNPAVVMPVGSIVTDWPTTGRS